MAAKRFPWQSSFRNVPKNIAAALQRIGTDFVQVAATKKVSLEDVASGLYAHLGMSLQNDRVVTGKPVLPQETIGTWSARNLFGWEIVQKDLPMITKTYTWETPNFGDYSRGTHMHSRKREVYQRHFFPPLGARIASEILSHEGPKHVLVKFSLDVLVDQNSLYFQTNLLSMLNLLQENAGVTGVFASNATRQEYIGTVALDWEVFPPGNVDEVMENLGRSRSSRFAEFELEARKRISLFNKLKPTKYLKGSGSFGSYFGAMIEDDLVIFENLEYGNALYVLYENWEDVSKRSRVELLRGSDEKFDRIIHTDGWQDRVIAHVKNELKSRRKSRRLL